DISYPLVSTFLYENTIFFLKNMFIELIKDAGVFLPFSTHNKFSFIYYSEKFYIFMPLNFMELIAQLNNIYILHVHGLCLSYHK
ncbi:hypothetical protein ACJX0J_018792, partial [Zea mays]